MEFYPMIFKVYFNEVFKSFSEAKYPIKKIKEVLENIKTGTTPHQKLNPYSKNDGFVFLRNTNLKKYQIDLSNTKYVQEQYENLLTFSEKNEVIMCIAGTVGLSAKNDVENPISINQNVSALKFFEDLVNPDFATYWFNSDIFLELTKRSCSIATIYYLNNDNLKFKCCKCNTEFEAKYSASIQHRVLCINCYNLKIIIFDCYIC